MELQKKGEIGGKKIGDVLNLDEAWHSTGVPTDSRSLKAGEVFFALKGDNFDGHDFVEKALSANAGAAVIEKAWFEIVFKGLANFLV